MDHDRHDRRPDDVTAPHSIAQVGDPQLSRPSARFDLPRDADEARAAIARLRLSADHAPKVNAVDGGYSLAAAQIGIARAAAIVRPAGGAEIVMVNPRVQEESAEEISAYEHCASLSNTEALVRRPRFVVVEYHDVNGEPHSNQFFLDTARLVLHAIDHLQGLLLTDRIEPGDEPTLSRGLRTTGNSPSGWC